MSKSAIVLAIPMLACIACGIVFSWHPVFTAVATFTSGVISAAGLGLRRQRLLVEWYLRRPTLYHAWITRYGADRKDQIKRFLRIYADAFFVDTKIIHKLGPDDVVMDFYLRLMSQGNLVRWKVKLSLARCKTSLGTLQSSATVRSRSERFSRR